MVNRRENSTTCFKPKHGGTWWGEYSGLGLFHFLWTHLHRTDSNLTTGVHLRSAETCCCLWFEKLVEKESHCSRMMGSNTPQSSDGTTVRPSVSHTLIYFRRSVTISTSTLKLRTPLSLTQDRATRQWMAWCYILWYSGMWFLVSR